jgi:hypothetical protein
MELKDIIRKTELLRISDNVYAYRLISFIIIT